MWRQPKHVTLRHAPSFPSFSILNVYACAYPINYLTAYLVSTLFSPIFFFLHIFYEDRCDNTIYREMKLFPYKNKQTRKHRTCNIFGYNERNMKFAVFPPRSLRVQLNFMNIYISEFIGEKHQTIQDKIYLDTRSVFKNYKDQSFIYEKRSMNETICPIIAGTVIYTFLIRNATLIIKLG